MQINEERFNSIITSQKAFNEFMADFKREIYLSIPDIVIKHIQDQHKYKKILDSFYQKYPEFKEDRVLIGSLANKISAENPKLSMEEIFDKAGKKARQMLRGYNEKL